MADKMDRGLDEIIADTRSSGPRNRRGGGGRGGNDRGDSRRRDRDTQDYPRDGVRKSTRNESRNLDSEWVHDRYEEHNNSRRAPAPRRRRESPETESRGARLRVENIHYELTQEDLEELFERIGPLVKLQLRYDRSGRSEGTAIVTYEHEKDASEAIRQFDGANANGQPIRLSHVSSGSRRNPFDTAVMPGRPLSERVSAPGGRSRSYSPDRKLDLEDAARKGIDRYVPGQEGRARSPMPRRRGGRDGGREGGRRPGARREPAAGARDNEGGRGGRASARPSKKTQEELDAEMADYFGGGGAPPAANADEGSNGLSAPAPAAPAAATGDDVDMIE